MKLVKMDGLTGKVKFDKSGLRTDFTLDIVELKRHGLEKVGSWHEKDGIKFSRNFMKTSDMGLYTPQEMKSFDIIKIEMLKSNTLKVKNTT